jgi:uncharacterized protein (DUF1778 family)
MNVAQFAQNTCSEAATDFIVSELQDAAAATIRDSETLRRRDAVRETFLNALLNPPEPNTIARAAMARYKKRESLAYASAWQIRVPLRAA